MGSIGDENLAVAISSIFALNFKGGGITQRYYLYFSPSCLRFDYCIFPKFSFSMLQRFIVGISLLISGPCRNLKMSIEPI